MLTKPITAATFGGCFFQQLLLRKGSNHGHNQQLPTTGPNHGSGSPSTERSGATTSGANRPRATQPASQSIRDHPPLAIDGSVHRPVIEAAYPAIPQSPRQPAGTLLYA